MPPASAQRCEFHRQRPAFAVCMQCRKTLCQECATQWDGIWYCAGCLAAQRGGTAQRSNVVGWLLLVAASLTFLFLSTRVMVWSGVLLAGLR